MESCPLGHIPLSYAQLQSKYHQRTLFQILPPIDPSDASPAGTPSLYTQSRGPSSLDSQESPITLLETNAAQSHSPGFPDFGNHRRNAYAEEPLTMENNKGNLIYGQLFDASPMPDPLWNPSSYPQDPSFSLGLNFLAQSQSSQPLQPDLLGTFGGPLRVPETFGLDAPPAINPDWLTAQPIQTIKAPRSPEYPASPLRSISPSSSFSVGVMDAFDDQDQKPRRMSDGDYPESSTKASKHRQNMTFSPGDQHPPDLDEDELEELAQFDQSGTGNRRDRRRLQNRIAQRGFRARSKVIHQEEAKEMTYLRRLTESQAHQMAKMSGLIERLQRENTSLKTGRWAEIQRQSKSREVEVEMGDAR